MDEQIYTEENCGECNSTVYLFRRMRKQYCPWCGKTVYPCNYCMDVMGRRHHSCEDCPIDLGLTEDYEEEQATIGTACTYKHVTQSYVEGSNALTLLDVLCILDKTHVKTFIKLYMRYVRAFTHYPSQFDYALAIGMALGNMGYRVPQMGRQLQIVRLYRPPFTRRWRMAKQPIMSSLKKYLTFYQFKIILIIDILGKGEISYESRLYRY